MGWLASGDPLQGRWCYVCRVFKVKRLALGRFYSFSLSFYILKYAVTVGCEMNIEYTYPANEVQQERWQGQGHHVARMISG